MRSNTVQRMPIYNLRTYEDLMNLEQSILRRNNDGYDYIQIEAIPEFRYNELTEVIENKIKDEACPIC